MANQPQKKGLALILLISIALAIPILIDRYNARSNSIDELGEALTGIEQILPKNTKILFKCHEEERDRYLYQTQFVLAPILLSVTDNQSEIVLLLETDGFNQELDTCEGCKVLFRNASGRFFITVYQL